MFFLHMVSWWHAVQYLFQICQVAILLALVALYGEARVRLAGYSTLYNMAYGVLRSFGWRSQPLSVGPSSEIPKSVGLDITFSLVRSHWSLLAVWLTLHFLGYLKIHAVIWQKIFLFFSWRKQLRWEKRLFRLKQKLDVMFKKNTI